MTKIKYCCDCDHYIPGGKERNCNLILPYSKGAVSALKEACGKFVEREERPKEKFAPIKFRRLKKYSKKGKIIESII
jgi:hypothetical protein